MAEQVDLNVIARRVDQMGDDVANRRDNFDNRRRQLESEPAP